MSNAGATLVLVFAMFALAIYFVFAPPPGFEEGFLHRLTIPFLLVACALSIFENLRTRTHMAQLVGAIRQLLGRSGVAPTPEGKREAIEILLKSLRSERASVRTTAAAQLSRLTGENFGEDAGAWDEWWAKHKADYTGRQS